MTVGTITVHTSRLQRQYLTVQWQDKKLTSIQWQLWQVYKYNTYKYIDSIDKHNESTYKHNESTYKHNESTYKYNESTYKHNESTYKYNDSTSYILLSEMTVAYLKV